MLDGMPIIQTGRTLQNFKKMRTICREIGKANTLQYFSRKDFLSLDPVDRTQVIEMPLVIAADASSDDEPTRCVQKLSSHT